MSLNYATDEGCFPLNLQLYPPEVWADDLERRTRAGIPENLTFKKKWQLGLDMIDRAVSWGLPIGIVAADAAYGMVIDFRAKLRDRQLRHVVGITGDVAIWRQPVTVEPPPYQGRGRRPTRQWDLPQPEHVMDVAKALAAEVWFEVSWREETKGQMRGRFASIRAQPAHGHTQGTTTEPMQWLLMEWPPDAAEPTKFWSSNLPEDTSLKDLVYWSKIRWWLEQNYQQLKDELGLDDFEARSWAGWHHHVTLTMIAFGFLGGVPG